MLNGKSWKTTLFGSIGHTLVASGAIIAPINLPAGIALVVIGSAFNIAMSASAKDSNVTTDGDGKNRTVKQ